jgi:hypothetical protein
VTLEDGNANPFGVAIFAPYAHRVIVACAGKNIRRVAAAGIASRDIRTPSDGLDIAFMFIQYGNGFPLIVLLGCADIFPYPD